MLMKVGNVLTCIKITLGKSGQCPNCIHNTRSADTKLGSGIVTVVEPTEFRAMIVGGL